MQKTIIDQIKKSNSELVNIKNSVLSKGPFIQFIVYDMLTDSIVCVCAHLLKVRNICNFFLSKTKNPKENSNWLFKNKPFWLFGM